MSALHPAWKDWYYLKHKDAATAQGTAFEDYVERILVRHHDDFTNPSPAGTLGDGGCDGLADSGQIMYACYGSRAKKDTERKLKLKIESDFNRGTSSWKSVSTWRFVTNAPLGPLCVQQITKLQIAHSNDSLRPLTIRLWNPEKLWIETVSGFGPEILNELFPGAPGMADIELKDLVPLLDALGSNDLTSDVETEIRPVPAGKVEFNKLPLSSQLELNSGRMFAPRIDSWFALSSNPRLHDVYASRFRQIYDENKIVAAEPGAVLERIYIAVGGSDFRLDNIRANAVYAVVAYFFDECHIFEEPPVDFVGWEGQLATTH